MESQDNKKRILYVVTQGEWGGAQRYIYDLVTNLDTNFMVSIAVGEAGGGSEMVEKFQITNNKLQINHKLQIIQLKHLVRKISPVHDILAIFELAKLYKTLKPDIIHLNSSKAGIIGSLANLLIFQSSNLSIIYTVHGWVFNEPLNSMKKWLYKFLEKITAKLKNKIIVLSDQDFDDGVKLGITKERLVRIPLGIEPPQFLIKEEARKKINRNREIGNNVEINDKLVCTIANLYPTKGLNVLVEAVEKIKNEIEIKNVKFVIIGEGKERSKLEKLIKKYHLENIVFLLGTIKNAAEYLPAFDLFVLPSRKEGTPYTILEAMTAGVPIITTPAGGIPSLLENKNECIMVKPDDPIKLATAINFAINNPGEMKRRAENAKKRSNDFTLDKMLRSTISLYSSFVQSTKNL